MNTKELRDKEDEALHLELANQQKELFTLRSQAVTEKLENPSLIGKSRRQIARIKTILRQRQLQAKQA